MKSTEFKYKIMMYCNDCNRVEETIRWLDTARRVAKIGCVHCATTRDIPLIEQHLIGTTPISEFRTWWIANWRLQKVNVSITKLN